MSVEGGRYGGSVSTRTSWASAARCRCSSACTRCSSLRIMTEAMAPMKPADTSATGTKAGDHHPNCSRLAAIPSTAPRTPTSTEYARIIQYGMRVP